VNILFVEDRTARLSSLIQRIESILGHDCHVFSSISAAQAFLVEPGSDVLAGVVSQRLCANVASPLGQLPTIVISDGLPVKANMLIKAENVLDYVMDYGQHNHFQIISLLRRAQFQGKIKILVVDNEQVVRNLFCNVLKKHGFHMLQAKNGIDALNMLAEHSEIRLVLTEMDMPGMSGEALIHAIREKTNKQELPIIGLADGENDQETLQFLRIGANDVITKPPRLLHEVIVRVMQNLAIAESFQEILELSRKDSLTGLFNRRHFYETAEKLFAQVRRGKINVAVAMIDIDNFKKVNDTLGHAAGDIAILDTGRILKGCLRDTDVVARFGGEEYCIMLAGLESTRDACLVMSRMVARVREHRMRFEGVEFSITVSCGVALHPMDSLEEMIKESDRLLLEAKAKGKDCLVCSDP
jgi:diguanylate cyclase (GGDEF)-like protein